MRALVIEPQIFTSFMIEDALRDAGFTEVDLVASEEEAVAAAEASPPDLVTAAVKLRPGDGIRAVERIRAAHDVSVLFITQRVADVEEKAPEDIVLRKPFLFGHLPPAIDEARRGR